MTLHTDSTTTRHHLRSPLERKIYRQRNIQREVGKCKRNGGKRIIENPFKNTDKYLRVRQMGALILSYGKRKHREQQVKWTLRGSEGGGEDAESRQVKKDERIEAGVNAEAEVSRDEDRWKGV